MAQVGSGWGFVLQCKVEESSHITNRGQLQTWCNNRVLTGLPETKNWTNQEGPPNYQDGSMWQIKKKVNLSFIIKNIYFFFIIFYFLYNFWLDVYCDCVFWVSLQHSCSLLWKNLRIIYLFFTIQVRFHLDFGVFFFVPKKEMVARSSMPNLSSWRNSKQYRTIIFFSSFHSQLPHSTQSRLHNLFIMYMQ